MEKNVVKQVENKKELTLTEKLYLNRLTTNLKDMDKELRKRLTKSVKDTIEQILDASANKKYFNIQVSDNVRDNLTYDLKLALGLADNVVISNRMLEKAIISASKNKFIASGKANIKIEGFAYSVSDFLKSLNASIYGKIAK